MNARTPSADVSHAPAVRRGARPPHVTDALWWLVYVSALCAALLYLN